MKLIYRGVKYQEENRDFSTVVLKHKEIIYRGNYPEGKINPKFPWLSYIKQLFGKSQSKPVLDPITFWYDHKRKFVEDCWFLDDIEKLDRAWNLTLQIERSKALRSKQKIELKYRGVTYYR